MILDCFVLVFSVCLSLAISSLTITLNIVFPTKELL